MLVLNAPGANLAGVRATDEAESTTVAEPEKRSGCRRVARAALAVVLAILACIAGTLIVAVVGGLAYAQLGPGGMLSSVRVGSPAPDFDLPTLDGGTIRLSDHRGHPVAVAFWATYCKRCVEELPALEQATERHSDEGLVVITVNPRQVRSHLHEFLGQRGITLTVAIDAYDEVWRTYRIVALPTTVWVDAEGVVRAVDLDILTPEIIDQRVRELVAATESTSEP